MEVKDHDSLDQYIKFDISGKIEVDVQPPPINNDFEIKLDNIHPDFSRNIQDKYDNYLHKGRANVVNSDIDDESSTWEAN